MYTYYDCLHTHMLNTYIHTYIIIFSQYVPVASSLINTNSVFDFDPDDLMNTYSLVVTCEINPTSSAEYCEVIAGNDNTAISGELV